jgi:hypothetical protein
LVKRLLKGQDITDALPQPSPHLIQQWRDFTPEIRKSVSHLWRDRRIDSSRDQPVPSARHWCRPQPEPLTLRPHGLEVLGCNAVELQTHHLNAQSRAAIEPLGSKLNGILRQHVVMPNQHIRDTAVYSIVRDEGPAVKASSSED